MIERETNVEYMSLSNNLFICAQTLGLVIGKQLSTSGSFSTLEKSDSSRGSAYKYGPTHEDGGLGASIWQAVPGSRAGQPVPPCSTEG